MLGEGVGEIGSSGEIYETIINGTPVSGSGYIDIGLHDTMKDMLVEAFGAVFFGVFSILDRGKHKLLYPVEK